MFKVPEKYRITTGLMQSSFMNGNNGAFHVHQPAGTLGIIASDQGGWEHVSVSLGHRCPTWAEMCAVKDMFWDKEDCVVQYHPPEKDYVNHHPYCLHMWRKVGFDFPQPPVWMIGPK